MPAELKKNPWLGIEPGLLRHRVEIQTSVEVNDTFGQPIPAWSALYQNVKANVEPLNGQELFEARQLYSEVTHRITARYVPGVTTKHRVLWGTRVFDILAALNLEERNLVLEIMAKEKSTDVV